MRVSKSWLYPALFTIGILYFCYIILFSCQTKSRWDYFPDVNDYKTQSEAGLLSSDFYAPKPKPGVWFFPRPFTVPLFLKMVGSDPAKLVVLQKYVYCICIISLLIAILRYIAHPVVKIIAQCGLLFFFTWWNIVGWADIPISESLSLSLMFLWFSSILFYYKKQSKLNLLFLIVITFLLSFTRDTWPYIILLFFTLNMAVSKWLLPHGFKKSIGLFVFSIALFFLQNYTSNVGERYRLPVFNSLAARVSKNDEYLAWFKKQGMPQGDVLKKDFKNADVDENDILVTYKRYEDGTYKELFEWIIKDGKSKYQQFLLTHPFYLFLQDIPSKEIEQNVFIYNISDYYQGSEGFFLNAEHVFPIFNKWVYLIIVLIAVFLFIKTKEILYVFPVIVFFLFIANALLSYDADGLEIKRHLFITRIVMEFISVLILLLLINYSTKSIKILKKNDS